jgi:hypothetical protein
MDRSADHESILIRCIVEQDGGAVAEAIEKL